MDVRWVNPFMEGARDVMTALGVTVADWGDLSVEEGALTSRDVTVLLGVGGALGGAVLLATDGETVVRMAAAMIGDGVMRPYDDELVVSAISEFGNMLVGRASVLLEEQSFVCTITPPAVIIGRSVAITIRPFRRLTLPANTDVGTVWLSVALKAASGKEATPSVREGALERG